MSKVETIKHDGVVIAHIIYKGYMNEGIEFFSANEDSLQLGYMTRPKGYQVIPHIHNLVPRNIVATQEVLFIKNGEILIDFYSVNQEYLESRQLSSGDIILFVSGAHGIEFLAKTEIIEVKTGPYLKDADKGRFEGKRNKE